MKPDRLRDTLGEILYWALVSALCTVMILELIFRLALYCKWLSA